MRFYSTMGKIAGLARVLVPLLTLLVTSAESDATLVTPFTPRQAAARSGLVFAGTVSAILPERAHGFIVTRVVFRDLRFGKGASRSDSLVLTLAGGTVGNEFEVVDGQPAFERERRYIVFAISDLGSPANNYMPVIGLHQGYFRVEPASTLGMGRVRDWQGLHLVAVAPERVTVVLPDSLIPAQLRTELDAKRHRDAVHGRSPEAQAGQPRRVLLGNEDPGTRLTEEEFLTAVREFSR
jgi:hypothetical protein